MIGAHTTSAFAFIAGVSLGVPYLYRALRGEGDWQRGLPIGLHVILIFMPSLAIFGLLYGSISLFWPLLGLDPFLPFSLPFCLLLTLPGLAITLLNWYKFFVSPSLPWLPATLMGLGLLTVGLGLLYASYLPLLFRLPPSSGLILSAPLPAAGVALTATGIYVWVRRQQIFRQPSA